MSLVRICCLIVLTLAATTMPARARIVPAKSKTPTEQGKSQSADSTEKKDKDKSKDKSPNHVGPRTDLWDGGARAVTAGSGLVLIASLLSGDQGTRVVPAEPRPVAALTIAIPRQQTQLDRLTCRCAHAPPFRAKS